ncbi:MAG: PBSX family phage terminase large subunit [Clostridia bacterium]|nr:PBSX family phage terminase large subunit [Clostridia bacterium]
MQGGCVYLPDVIGGGYGGFWRCRSRYRVVKGGKASKKSSTTALWYIYHLMKYPDANLLVVRNVHRTHLDSTYAQLRWAIRRLEVEHLWRAVREPLELTYLPTGQRILFRGMDNVEKLASTTVERGYLCWVWIEEAFEIASEADFDKLDLSVPRGELPKPLFKQTTITFNPWDENHWLKGRFFDRTDPNVYAITTDYRCNEFLDSTDRVLYERMREKNPRKYAVAGLGEWGHSEGLVFENWAVEEFSLGELHREGLRHVFGLDYGYTNDPTAFIAAAVEEETKRIYLYDEHYQRRMLNEDIAAMIVEKGYQKERIRADAAEPKSNEDLRRLGICRLQAANKGRDSILSGISRLQEYRLVVHPRCVHTAAELRSYVWQADGRDGVYRNLPSDKDNHLMDALRYAMEDVPRPPVGQGKITRYGLPRGGWKG